MKCFFDIVREEGGLKVHPRASSSGSLLFQNFEGTSDLVFHHDLHHINP